MSASIALVPPDGGGTIPPAESTSPFLVWSAEDLAPIRDVELELERPGLLVDLLRSPEGVARRLLTPRELQATLSGSLAVTVTSMALLALAVGAGLNQTPLALLRGAALVPANILLAAAAAFGPAYATSILVAARLPMARLVAALTSALAAGAVILAALAPLPYVLLRLDPLWAGPLSLVGAFGLAALVGGARVRAILLALATLVRRATVQDPSAALPEDDAHRVGIFARVTMMILAMTVSLSFWAFDALF